MSRSRVSTKDFVAAVEGEVEFGEIAELGLPDTKIARDLVAQGQALGDAIPLASVLTVGIGSGDLREHCRRDQAALDRERS